MTSVVPVPPLVQLPSWCKVGFAVRLTLCTSLLVGGLLCCRLMAAALEACFRILRILRAAVLLGHMAR